MKKAAVLFSLLLLCAATSVFANGGSEQPTTSTTRPHLEVTTLYYFDSGDATTNMDLKEEFPKWFSDHFNVDLKINYYPRPEYMEKLSLAISSGEIHGIAQIFGGNYMGQMYNDGATLDILPYIKDNANWLKMPEEMRTSYVFSGNLQAFPSAWAPGSFFARSIRKDWLDKFGLAVPQTIDQLYTAVKKFTEDDPDGNGKNDTVGMTTSGIWNMQDIFMAFGVPTNHVGDHLITPDPHDGMRFNDGMLKPQIYDALNWLRDVYKNGYMDPELWTNGGSDMRERMQNGYAGSTYYWNTWVFSFENGAKKTDPNAQVVPILGLTSKDASDYVNLGGGYGAGAPWVLLSGTQDPREEANTFANLFYGNADAHWSGRFGIMGKYWDYGPNQEIVRLPWTQKDDGTYTYYPGPNIMAGDFFPLYNLAKQGYIVKGTESSSDAFMTQNTAYQQWQAEGDAKKLFFYYTEQMKEPQSDTYAKIGADIKRLTVQAVTDAMTGQKTVEQAVADYRSQMKALGAQKVLDEGNAAIGKTSSTVYRY
jgi:ABC-type glycerol-3-phosphate transport system substrate-binding protein